MVQQNKDKNDIQQLYHSQKTALYCLLGLLYSAFIGAQLGRVQAITDFNFTLHELMYLPFNIAIYFGPIVLLIYLILVIKYLRKRGKQKLNAKTIFKSTLIVISIIAIVAITLYQFHEISTGGIFEVKGKVKENNHHYLLLDDKKIRVTNNEFHLVEVDKRYVISFVWNSRTPGTGRLKEIKPFE